MRFHIATLLLFTTLVAFAFYSATHPSFVLADVLEFLLGATSSVGFVIAFFSRGRLQSAAIAYSIFTIMFSRMGFSPQSFAGWMTDWLNDNVTSKAPVEAWIVTKTINNSFAMLLGFFAAAMSSSIVHRQGHNRTTAEAKSRRAISVLALIFTAMAFVIYSTMYPSFLMCDLMELVLNTACACALMVAYHSCGRIQVAAIAFSAFSVVFSWLGSCPDSIAEWIAVNVSQHDGIPAF